VISKREAQDAYLRKKSQYNKSRGVAWAQRCLEGSGENKTLVYEAGREAERLLREAGWERIDVKWTINRKRYDPSSRHKADYERYTYRSYDGRFEVSFVFSHGGNPGTCWCGFKKLKGI